MVEAGILDRGDICQGICRSVYILAERNQSLWSRLEMVVVRSGCSALRTVVEEGETVIFTGEVQHIDVPAPDRLVSMSG